WATSSSRSSSAGSASRTSRPGCRGTGASSTGWIRSCRRPPSPTRSSCCSTDVTASRSRHAAWVALRGEHDVPPSPQGPPRLRHRRGRGLPRGRPSGLHERGSRGVGHHGGQHPHDRLLAAQGRLLDDARGCRPRTARGCLRRARAQPRHRPDGRGGLVRRGARDGAGDPRPGRAARAEAVPAGHRADAGLLGGRRRRVHRPGRRLLPERGAAHDRRGAHGRLPRPARRLPRGAGRLPARYRHRGHARGALRRSTSSGSRRAPTRARGSHVVPGMRHYTGATVSGYRRTGALPEPQRHVASVPPARRTLVRPRWALGVFSYLVSIGLVAAFLVEPSGLSSAATLAAASDPVDTRGVAGQSVTVDGEATASARDGFEVVKPKPKRVVGTAPAVGVPDPGTAQAIAYDMVMAYGWGQSEFDCLVALWNKESGWNAFAHNRS